MSPIDLTDFLSPSGLFKAQCVFNLRSTYILVYKIIRVCQCFSVRETQNKWEKVVMGRSSWFFLSQKKGASLLPHGRRNAPYQCKLKSGLLTFTWRPIGHRCPSRTASTTRRPWPRPQTFLQPWAIRQQLPWHAFWQLLLQTYE